MMAMFLNNLSTTDATGQTLAYAYDPLNRLTQISNGATPLITKFRQHRRARFKFVIIPPLRLERISP